MKANRVNYLRSYRLRWGLSQRELASLFGYRNSAVLSRIEKRIRLPTIRILVGCFVLFGTPPSQIFPDVTEKIEGEVMSRVWKLYEDIQGNPSRRTKKKIELLESAIHRAEQNDRKYVP
jgi:transcriptional regulator with XRE-family HTH domain